MLQGFGGGDQDKSQEMQEGGGRGEIEAGKKPEVNPSLLAEFFPARAELSNPIAPGSIRVARHGGSGEVLHAAGVRRHKT